MSEDPASVYYDCRLNELQSTSRLIAALTAHSSTLGTFREQALIRYIRNFVPPIFRVKSGFVGGRSGSHISSRQVDILIYESMLSTPYYEDDTLVVAHPDSVVAAIEVKSHLTLSRVVESKEYQGTIFDAFKNIHSVAQACARAPGIFYGVLGFDSDCRVGSIYEMCDSGNLDSQLGITELAETPRIICDISKFCACITHKDLFSGNEWDEYHSFFSELSIATSSSNSIATRIFPLRFFSVYLLNFLKVKTNFLIKIETDGMHAVTAGAKLRTYSHHFQLNCKSFLQQPTFEFQVKTSK